MDQKIAININLVVMVLYLQWLVTQRLYGTGEAVFYAMRCLSTKNAVKKVGQVSSLNSEKL